MSPLVSVVMPAFNAERHIAESIESVMGQTCADWELVVVDDGSADGTARVVARFCADPRVRYVRRENGGQAAARNTGIRHTAAPLVAFLDADDLWLPEKLERQLEVLGRTGADLVYADGYVFFDDGSPERDDAFAVVPGPADGATMLRLLHEQNRIATLSVVVRRGALERVGLFDESRRIQNCEDYDLWLRLARAGCGFYGMAERLVRYRRHSASTTHRESGLIRPWIEVVKKHGDSLGPAEFRRRVRGLYRELVAALVREGDLAGARAAMREFAAWDGHGLVTTCQRVLLRVSPRSLDRVSRRCLYPVEWRVSRLMDKLRAA
ncbi:MAG TPA: glycosyltransferase [Pyrinomonadaceae bacterium]|jgi:glycosyltransferase involved in cell wall biosynthesis